MSSVSDFSRWTISPSMSISPNSFSMTTIFFPWFCVKMWFNNVVFPLPRNPVKTVIGILSSSFLFDELSVRVVVFGLLFLFPRRRPRGSSSSLLLLLEHYSKKPTTFSSPETSFCLRFSWMLWKNEELRESAKKKRLLWLRILRAMLRSFSSAFEG